MSYTRRDTLLIGLGASAAAMLPIGALADVAGDIAAFTGGAAVGEGGITLTAPEMTVLVGGMRVLNYTFTGAVDKKLHDRWVVVKSV